MTDRAAIGAGVDRLIARLSGPLPTAELACGWSEAARTAFLAYYERLRLALEAPDAETGARRESIARDLDYWGIAGGEFAAAALAIAAAVRAETATG